MNTICDTQLIPVRSLHNYAYCPRLCYLQWVEKIFEENEDTVAGDAVHQRVDHATTVPDADDIFREYGTRRSLWLESPALGITGVIDYAECAQHGIVLIDYKKGSALSDEHGLRAKQNDALQVAAQALLLQEHGQHVTSAFVYYAASRVRVPVELTDSLFDEVRALIARVREMAVSLQCPPPLENDVRCLYCSAYPVCLPNESIAWHRTGAACADTATGQLLEEAQRLAATPITRAPRPACDPGDVLIVHTPRARVGVHGDRVIVAVESEERASVPLHQLRALYLYGPVQVSTQATHLFLEHGISVAYFTAAGRFLGLLSGLPLSGIDARIGQYDTFRQPSKALQLAKSVIYAKIHNQRVMLMRNGTPADATVRELARLRDSTEAAADMQALLGLEGAAAHLYFRHFHTMLSTSFNFTFDGRHKRPPTDPINALLSWAYSTLVKELTGVLHAVGLDPFFGFMHQPRYGRPALALDLMEEFRPLIADSTVIALVNRKEIDAHDFVATTRGVMLKDSARRAFWRAYFRRMDSEITHPQFGYRMSYRRMLEVQARQLWRHVRGEAPVYIGFTTR